MASREPTYRTLRLLCANGAGMVGFLIAYVIGREFAAALIAGAVMAAVGYAASSSVAAYAGA